MSTTADTADSTIETFESAAESFSTALEGESFPTAPSDAPEQSLFTSGEHGAPPPTTLAPSIVTSAPEVVRVPVSAASSKSKKKKIPPPANNICGATGAQGENTGRWTAEEHRLFLQGLEQHGKGWKKIASLIKSRTVVQIRTHAQKYFQKLAKARQNGEEGDVSMEGRGGVASVVLTSGSTTGTSPVTRRRRQITGTKRKCIQSVVASAQRQGKKMAAAQAAAGVPNPVPPIPSVAPALAHFVLPGSSGAFSTSSAAQGNISGPALEDSLFRFLTPVPVQTSEPQVSSVARKAGANPITVPSSNPSTAPLIAGEVSPTGVQDLTIYPSWTDAKDLPSWYSKGADVDVLLDVADTLDWLADTGELNETYEPPEESDDEVAAHTTTITEDKANLGMAAVNNSTSVSTLPHVDSNVESVVPPLPSLFEGSTTHNKDGNPNETVASAKKVLDGHSSEPDMHHFEVFDTPMEENDFVSTILDSKNLS